MLRKKATRPILTFPSFQILFLRAKPFHPVILTVDFFWFHAESDVTHGVRQLLFIDEAIVVEIEGREGQLNVVRRQLISDQGG